MSIEDNKRVVARAIAEVINGGNLAAVDQLYAPEITTGAGVGNALPRGLP